MGITDLIGTGIAIVTSILTIGIHHGVMKSKIQDMKEDLSDFKSERDEYVRRDYFDATVEPIQQSISEMQKDIKRILSIVSRHEFDKNARRTSDR